MTKEKNHKIVMIIASKQFRDEELFIPKNYFEHHNLDVTVASSSLAPSTGMLKRTISPDILVKNIQEKDVDIIVLVGGTGATEYWDDAILHQKLHYMHNSKKIIAAICIAPVSLAKAGLLKDIHATVYPSESSQLTQHGAILTNKDVVVDKNIITANGPEAAEEFAKTIIDHLSLEENNA